MKELLDIIKYIFLVKIIHYYIDIYLL